MEDEIQNEFENEGTLDDLAEDASWEGRRDAYSAPALCCDVEIIPVMLDDALLVLSNRDGGTGPPPRPECLWQC